MFVRKSKLIEVRADTAVWKFRYESLLVKWNALVDRINSLGGESFLQGNTTQFNSEDIKRLILLCHPDKHGNSQMANDMTKKLLTLKK